MVLRVQGRIDHDGHLRLDVPTQLRAGDVEVIVNIQPSNGTAAPIDFSDLVGRLKWRGDAVAEQRELRDEW